MDVFGLLTCGGDHKLAAVIKAQPRPYVTAQTA